jgi:hypothetical protein
MYLSEHAVVLLAVSSRDPYTYIDKSIVFYTFDQYHVYGRPIPPVLYR